MRPLKPQIEEAIAGGEKPSAIAKRLDTSESYVYQQLIDEAADDVAALLEKALAALAVVKMAA